MWGQRYDPLREASARTYRALCTLRATKADAAEITKAEKAFEVARNAIRSRDLQRKKTRELNKELRKQGIDPSKKPEAMTVEQFEASRRTLRAAIQPQFAAYKEQMFNVLRARVDEIFKKLESHGWNAYSYSYNEDYATLYARSWKEGTRFERDVLRAQIEAGNAKLAEARKWTKESEMLEGKTRDRGIVGAWDMRSPLSDRIINATLTQQAHDITERDFDSYTQKLAGKIGKTVASAKVIGNLWMCSILVVRFDEAFWNDVAESEVQRWSTKMILNFSALGTPYNQWPTRRTDINQ